jgi:Helix-turn-helix domain
MDLHVLKVADVAALLGCAISTVEERARSGDLPGLKFGDGGWVFPAGALAMRLDELAIAQAAVRREPTPCQPRPQAHTSARLPPTLPRV